MIAPRTRVVYTPVAKAMSTSLLWFFGRAEGNPDARRHLSVRGVGAAQGIHDPDVHGLRRLDGLSDRELTRVLTAPDWLRLAVVRDPFDRLVSAWQFTVLLQGAASPLAELHDPVVGADGSVDLGASFRRFVSAMDERWERVRLNPHFRPQIEFLRPDLVRYDLVAKVEQPGLLLRALGAHSPLLDRELPRVNEGLGFTDRRWFDDDGVAVVRHRYAADFAAFGYSLVPIGGEEPPMLTPAGRRLLDVVEDRTRQIGILRENSGIRASLARTGREVRRRAHRALHPARRRARS